MGKRKKLEIPLPNWTWWQTTKSAVSIILACRIDLNNEIVGLLRELIRLLSG